MKELRLKYGASRKVHRVTADEVRASNRTRSYEEGNWGFDSSFCPKQMWCSIISIHLVLQIQTVLEFGGKTLIGV